MSQNAPTFADPGKGTSKSNLKRPTSLNFKTKANLKRREVIELLKEINFELQKLVDVVEMRSRNINITRKTREDTLQLFEQLRQTDFYFLLFCVVYFFIYFLFTCLIDFVYNIRLYKFDNISVSLIWFFL